MPGPGCHCPGHGGPRALGQPTLLCVRGAHGHHQDGVAPWTGPAQSQELQHQAGGHCQLGTEGGGTGRRLSRAGRPQDTGAHGQLSRSWDGRARGPRGPPAQGKGPEVQGWTSPRPRFLGTAAEHEPPLPGVHSAARSLSSLGTVPRRWAGSAVQGRTRPGRAERMPPHAAPVLAGRPLPPTPPPPRWLEAARVRRMLHGGSPSQVCRPGLRRVSRPSDGEAEGRVGTSERDGELSHLREPSRLLTRTHTRAHRCLYTHADAHRHVHTRTHTDTRAGITPRTHAAERRGVHDPRMEIGGFEVGISWFSENIKNMTCSEPPSSSSHFLGGRFT